ncbi:Serine/threonine-protein kinase rio1 [Glugoides intestinalis]
MDDFVHEFDSLVKKIEKRRKDKSDTATVDKVLDPKTVTILKKLITREKLFELSGAFSTGKEANIYTAKCSTSLISKFVQKEADIETEAVVTVALKIYKTSTMLFKDRARYIIDEKRFKNFCTSNSRKLIKLWSEKEVRNLKRLAKNGIACPKPLYLKGSVLIMTMIGDERPAPRLRDAELEKEEWQPVYLQCTTLIKDMYQKARLIHADFSEYNLIYHMEKVFVIDVSQSMDINQENSNMFLMMDLCNCNDFFTKKGVVTRSEVELFEEITKLKIPEYLKVDGRLNKDSFIPSRIIEIANEEDIGLFVDKEEDNGSADDGSIGSESADDGSIGSESADDELVDIDLNEIHEIDENYETVVEKTVVEKKAESNFAKFSLKSYADLTADSINIYVRRLCLKDPTLTKEDEKEINKMRKLIVKQMNRERRIKRVERKDEYKGKNMKRKKNYFNK